MKLRNGTIKGQNVTQDTKEPPPKPPKLPTASTAEDFQAEQVAAGKGAASKLWKTAAKTSTSKRRDVPKDESDDEPATSSAADSAKAKRIRLTEETHETDPPADVDSAAAETSAATPAVTWSDKPPINELTGDAVTSMLEKFEENLTGWKIPSSHVESSGGSTSTPSAVNILTDEQKAWNTRVEDTSDKINAGFVAAYTDDTVLAYSVNDQPVGILVMSNTDPPYILQMATHPGSTGAGGALIEEAVNKSQGWGKKGKLKLKPLNDAAAKAYEAWGFKRVASGMELDPLDNDKWIKTNGEWRLKKYQDKPYVSGFGAQEPQEPEKKE